MFNFLIIFLNIKQGSLTIHGGECRGLPGGIASVSQLMKHHDCKFFFKNKITISNKR